MSISCWEEKEEEEEEEEEEEVVEEQRYISGSSENVVVVVSGGGANGCSSFLQGEWSDVRGRVRAGRKQGEHNRAVMGRVM